MSPELISKDVITGSSSPSDDSHAHALTRVNLQICGTCHRFFAITFEKNYKGESVETAHELDIRIRSSGTVKAEDLQGENTHVSNSLIVKETELVEDGCW